MRYQEENINPIQSFSHLNLMVSRRPACFLTFLFYFNPAVTVSVAILPYLLFELTHFKLPVLLKKILRNTTQVFGRFLAGDAVASSIISYYYIC